MPIQKAKLSIGDIVKHKHFEFRGVIYDVDFKFNNSEEKKLFLRQYYGSGLLVEDNNGNKFKGDTGLNLVMFYCKNDYIVLRAVEEINIYRGQVTNEFNENIKMPTIFWVREVGVEAKPPMMKKNYDF